MQSTTTLQDLISLSRNRWTIPLLADMAAHDGARFVELLHRLGVSRDSLSRTLQAVREAGWVIPNPGHGHPLRPEYILTQEGRRLAGLGASVLAAQARIDLSATALTRWGLPLVSVIDRGETRFNGMARLLPGATPRALSQGLRGLAQEKLVIRELVDTYPPVTRYCLSGTGQILADAN